MREGEKEIEMVFTGKTANDPIVFRMKNGCEYFCEVRGLGEMLNLHHAGIILRAVNSHEALLSTIKYMRDVPQKNWAFSDIDKTIAQAEGK